MLFTMNPIERLSQDARITVRKSGAPDPAGKCVIYWMQRAQRAIDNPALDVAIRAGNELKKQVVVFLAPVPFYPRANRLCEAGEFEYNATAAFNRPLPPMIAGFSVSPRIISSK